jgi:hypothetical protein
VAPDAHEVRFGKIVAWREFFAVCQIIRKREPVLGENLVENGILLARPKVHPIVVT